MGMDKAVPEKGVQFTYCRLAPCALVGPLVGLGASVVVVWLLVVP